MGNPRLEEESSSTSPQAGSTQPGSPVRNPPSQVDTSLQFFRNARAGQNEDVPAVHQPLGPNLQPEIQNPGQDRVGPVFSISERLSPEDEDDRRERRRGLWPHRSSSVVACFCCVLGMYNISRFAVLVFVYKGCFIIEFLLLSFLLGVPFLYLMMTVGQYLGQGVLDMWKICPAFKGVGVALVYTYILSSVTSSVPISWLFVYFRDSFISTREAYRWTGCRGSFAIDECSQHNSNGTHENIGWSTASYFHGRVLDRGPKSFTGINGGLGEIKFELAFNLAIVWLLVFICLSRGLRSLGKVLYVLCLLPVILLILTSIRFYEQWGNGAVSILSTMWREALTDSSSWLAAAREAFLTWGMMGGVVLHMSSHNRLKANITRSLIIIVLLTLLCLVLSSLFFVSAFYALHRRNFAYTSSSYEEEFTVRFLQYGSGAPFDLRNVTPTNLFLGEALVTPQFEKVLSGYHVMRFATELFPAVLAVEGTSRISSFWSIAFYATVIIFGLGQLVVVWNCVVESIISLNPKVFGDFRTIVTFVMCNLAFFCGLPMVTKNGIFVLYFFDFTLGSLWWIVALYLLLIIAILFVRGRPYGTDNLVTILTSKGVVRTWLLPFLTFHWNVILPVSFLVLSIAFLRSGHLESTFSWAEQAQTYKYWPLWVKRLAVFAQIFPILCVVGVSLSQVTWHIGMKTHLTLAERIQSLCCPIHIPSSETSASTGNLTENTAESPQGVVNNGYEEDPPPKYTPPPSYSTATARILVRQLQRQRNSGIELDSIPRDNREVILQIDSHHPAVLDLATALPGYSSDKPSTSAAKSPVL